MNKVISIHLHGVAFQLEEGGYDALRAYLDTAARKLEGNPDKAEILADIEQAIADKFTARLSASRNVVLTAEVESVIAAIGPVDNGSDATADDKGGAKKETGPQPPKPDTPPAGAPKRLYRIKEGAMLTGVCNGLATYFGVDVTLVRLVMAILIFFSVGLCTIAYFAASIIIPEAKTPEQKAAASGPTQTAHDFVRMAREGYYEGMKAFPDREARREWKRKFQREMSDWKHNFRWQMKANFGQPRPEPVFTPCPPAAGSFFVLPVLSTLNALTVFALWFVIISLLATGSVLGLSLPGGLPVWAGVILIIIAHGVVTAPIKALRRAYYYRLQGQPYYWHPFTELWHLLITIGAIALSVWLADCFIPGFHQALMDLPTFLHNAADTVRQWWAHK